MPLDLGVKVEGLRELRRALSAAEAELPVYLREELREIGTLVARIAKPKVPTLTGRAAGSIRAAPSGANVYVKAGGASVPYYGWLDFGGTIHHVGAKHSHSGDHQLHRDVVKGGRYLYPAAEEAKPAVALATERMLDRVFLRAGWT